MTSQPPSENTATAAQRIGWATLILVTLYFCYFSHLGAIGLVGPDEPRYAWIARDMAETGDWVTPRLYDKPWFEKPPLLYWGGAVFFKLLGEDHPEVAARLPSAISALLATLALAWLAWRTYGEECARWLLLLLPTSVGMIGFSHAAATDMPFAGMLTIAMVCAAAVLGLTRTPEETPILPYTSWSALLLFGFFLGLATLAKGPAAIILFGGAVFLWAIFTKRWRDAFRLLHPGAIAAFCVTALPWYVLCARRNPHFFGIFIVEHNFKRYLTPEFQHLQPFWYYAPVLLVAFLPWSLLVVFSGLAAIKQWWRTRDINHLACLILCWVMFCLVFFTISKSKLPGYVLPAVPAIAFLCARAIADVTWFSRRFAGYLLVVSSGFGLGVWIILRVSNQLTESLVRLPASLVQSAIGILALFSFSAFLAGFSLFTRSNSYGNLCLRAASALSIILLIEQSPLIIERTYIDALSGKGLAHSLSMEVADLPKLRTFHFRRDYRYALNFYLHREVPEWVDAPIHDGYVVANLRYCSDLNTEDNCTDLWGTRDSVPGFALLRITPNDSLPRTRGGRKPD